MDLAKLIERAKGICLSPKTEWEKIAAETTDVKSLYLGYAVVLAAIPVIAGLIPMLRMSVGIAVAVAVLKYVLGLAVVFVVGLLINALAPTFDGAKEELNSAKLAVYSATPMWLAGIFHVIPYIGWIIALVAGLYGVYVLYLGFSPMMKSPEDKSLGYCALTVVCYIALMACIGLVTGAMFLSSVVLGGLRL